MKARHWFTVVLALAVVWLAWEAFNLSLENDGLKQVAEGHKRSIQTLLTYARVATRCSVTPQELTESLRATLHQSGGAAADVALLAFKAHFAADELTQLEIVDVGTTQVCQAK